MLSTRTKQVNSYGKRGKRTVDVTISNATSLPKEIISIFEDLPPPPAWAPIASRMKGRENATPKQKAPAPKVVGMQRRKRLSPVLSPIRKPARVSQLKKESNTSSGNGKEALDGQSKPKVKSLLDSKNAAATMLDSPPRAPLSSFPVNVPGSPMPSPSLRNTKPRVPSTRAPSKLGKSVPSVTDIIILDDAGRTISTERRTSRTRTEMKPAKIARQIQKPFCTNSRMPIYVDLASDSEGLKPEKKVKKRATRAIINDESEPDDEPPPPPPIAAEKVVDQKPANNRRLARATTVEVIVPRAPYPTKQIPRIAALPNSVQPAATLPNIARPATPPKPRAQIMPTRAPVFNLPASPIFKVRQLTPIRGGRTKGLFEHASPSTSDLDLSFDLAELSLDSEGIPGNPFVEHTIQEYLKPILAECHQEDCGPHDFSSFIESFPFDAILQSSREKSQGDLTFKKIGEASYSEVFGIGDVVLKVIPLRDESPKAASLCKQHTLKLASRGIPASHDLDDDLPPPSDAQDVRKEIVVTRAMGEVHHGFVKLLKTYIVKGKYPEALLNLWDDYNEQKGSESIRPAAFSLSQVYAIIVLPNGGPDLEAYTFTTPSKSGWRQASSIFWQVAKSLAHAEHLVSFEHRDLHWGQILVKNVPFHQANLKTINMNSGTKSRSGKRAAMDDLNHGVQVTIIDLGLSRMDAGDGSGGNRVQWTSFDEEVFMGVGDYQFDVYRMMRNLTAGDWAGYHPMTSVMWLYYLVTKLLHAKGLKPPSATRKAKGIEAPMLPADPSGFSEKDCYEALVDIEQWLCQTLIATFPTQAKATAAAARVKSRKTAAAPFARSNFSDGPVHAGEIVEYGVKKGWIRASALF